MRELQHLEGKNGRSVRIIETAAHSWQNVAIALDFDGPQMKSIERDYPSRSEDACREMFVKWLDGDPNLRSPVSWDTLIDCLEKARLEDLAENVKHCLSQCQ